MRVGQWTLGDLRDALRKVPDGQVFLVGFDDAYSYRGDYSEAAVQVATMVPVERMRAVVDGIIGTSKPGYKGGMYLMTEHSDVWIVEDPGSIGETMGSLMWSLMAQWEVVS